MIAKNILHDSYYENGAVESEEYSSFYSDDVLFHYKVKELLRSYGQFDEDYFDKKWHWYSFCINESGKNLIENKEELDYDKTPQECNWYEILASFMLMGSVCCFLGILIYELTIFFTGLNIIINSRIFQIITLVIIIGFLFIAKSIYNRSNKRRNKSFLIISALALVYMIVYESVMESIIGYTYEYIEHEYFANEILIMIQFCSLGTVCWYLFCRKWE